MAVHYEIVPSREVRKPYGLKTVRVKEREAQFWAIYQVRGRERVLEMELDSHEIANEWVHSAAGGRGV